MSAEHSRKGAAQKNKMRINAKTHPSSSNHFMLSYKGDRVKVVNADSGELKLLTSIIRRHCQILKEGWDRHLTFSFKLKVGGRHCMIQLVADTLLSLYQAGWEPMTPVDLTSQKNQEGLKSSICFRQRKGTDLSESMGSLLLAEENACLSMEIYKSNFIGFHNVSNTLLLDLVTTIQKEWSPGIRGVSMGVASVITDYTSNMPPVLTSHPHLREERYLQLEGRPWEGSQDQGATENLQLAIIACLTREGYKLSMDINMEAHSRVFFFIRDTEEQTGEVRIPNMTGAGLGEKDTLSVYRPMVIRSGAKFYSFFLLFSRSRMSFLGKHGNNARSMKRKVTQRVGSKEN